MAVTLEAIGLVTTGEAAQAAHVEPERIRDWARRRLITPADRTPEGHPLYALSDVWEIELATRHGRGRRRPS